MWKYPNCKMTNDTYKCNNCAWMRAKRIRIIVPLPGLRRTAEKLINQIDQMTRYNARQNRFLLWQSGKCLFSQGIHPEK